MHTSGPCYAGDVYSHPYDLYSDMFGSWCCYDMKRRDTAQHKLSRLGVYMAVAAVVVLVGLCFRQRQRGGPQHVVAAEGAGGCWAPRQSCGREDPSELAELEV